MILHVAFLDVFHGDCAVLTFDERDRRACIVIDGGEKKAAAKRLAAYLKHEEIEVIDLLVATHIDSDHVYGLVHFLEKESGRPGSWNRGKQKCIRHYWGPKPDPNWTPASKKEATRVLPAAARRLRTRDFVIQSVKQNQDLSKLVRAHIFNEDNIRYPSLQDMPPSDIFTNVEICLMAPDMQILDSAIQAKALAMSNLTSSRQSTVLNSSKTWKPLTLQDIYIILAKNNEEMAKIANRNANNQSIVLKLTPREGAQAKSGGWSFLFTGDAEQESWEMMRGISDVRENLQSKVLKLPHHGSHLAGIDKASYEMIDPEYNIISVGQKHGLPDGQMLNLVKKDKNRKLFCTERNNSKSHPGPCTEARCVREKATDFRSIRFTIDTNSGKENIDIFTINTNAGSIEPKTDEVWCQEIRWPER